MKQLSVALILLCLLVSGCASTSSVAPEYAAYQYSGEVLAIAPFTFDFIESKRKLLVFRKADTTGISSAVDGDSVGIDFVADHLVEAFETHSLFESVRVVAEMDTSSWNARILNSLDDGKPLVEFALPDDGEALNNLAADFVLLVGFAEADFRERYSTRPNPDPTKPPTRKRDDGTFTMEYVLWHISDAKPFSWGRAEALQCRLRIDRPEEWQRIANELARQITKNSPFDSPDKTVRLTYRCV